MKTLKNGEPDLESMPGGEKIDEGEGGWIGETGIPLARFGHPGVFPAQVPPERFAGIAGEALGESFVKPARASSSRFGIDDGVGEFVVENPAQSR